MSYDVKCSIVSKYGTLLYAKSYPNFSDSYKSCIKDAINKGDITLPGKYVIIALTLDSGSNENVYVKVFEVREIPTPNLTFSVLD